MASGSNSVRLDRLVLSRSAPREIMNSPGVVAKVAEVSERVRAAADAASPSWASYGNAPVTQKGKTRAHSIVYTANAGAIHDNHRHNTLLKAAGGKAV